MPEPVTPGLSLPWLHLHRRRGTTRRRHRFHPRLPLRPQQPPQLLRQRPLCPKTQHDHIPNTSRNSKTQAWPPAPWSGSWAPVKDPWGMTCSSAASLEAWSDSALRKPKTTPTGETRQCSIARAERREPSHRRTKNMLTANRRGGLGKPELSGELRDGSEEQRGETARDSSATW